MELGWIEEAIRKRSGKRRRDGCLLAAISGIHGSGKSSLAARVVRDLRAAGYGTAGISLDPWRSLSDPHPGSDPAEHFYLHAFRVQELFDLLIHPLRRDRSHRVTVEMISPPSLRRAPRSFDFRDVEIIVLDGNFLLRRDLRPLYDLAFWLDCSFDTALRRATERDQGVLSEEEIAWEHTTLYFPAQRIHLERDDPRGAADLVLDNSAPFTGRAVPPPALPQVLPFPSPSTRAPAGPTGS